MKTFAETQAEVAAAANGFVVVQDDPDNKFRGVARIVHRWRTLMALDYVQLRCEPDEDFDRSYFEQGVFNEDDEAFGSIGEFCLDPDSSRKRWHNADSVWGHVGYKNVQNWKENPYIVDIMDVTMEQLRRAWKERVHGICPRCHGTGLEYRPNGRG